MNLYFKIIIVLCFLSSCSKNKEQKYLNEDIKLIHACEKKLTDLIVVDIFSPPVASRIYANVSIAMYEAAKFSNTDSKSISEKLNGFDGMPIPKKNEEYDFTVSMLKAYTETAQKVIFSVDEIKEFERVKMESLKKRNTKEVFDRSIDFGIQVSKVVIKRLNSDNYKETRGMDRFEVKTKDLKRWIPTAPDYADGLEPHWSKMKTMVLDSASQFKPISFPNFDLTKDSEFSKELDEVYSISKSLTVEQKNITAFWDDNASVSKHMGHVEFQDKKMTPGGHWMAICRTAALKNNLSFIETLKAYALTSISIYDGFISCWDEKYRSLRVRPQTAINKTKDENWISFLQTPPFPEYTSGHSTISASAAEVLTYLFNDNFSYIDSTELEYGLPVRQFKSFKAAADEASISRVYGGIHFKSGCVAGSEQGSKVGKIVINKLK